MSLSHSERFLRLTQQLKQYAPIWQSSPFTERNPDWQQSYPAFNQALLALSEQELQQLDKCPDSLHGFTAKFLPEFKVLLPALELNRVTQQATTDRFASCNIPGRKWQQITAFIGAIQQKPELAKAQETLDWCSGKSHLGRTSARLFNTRLTAIEFDKTLCEQGLLQAEQAGVQADFICADVLALDVNFKEGQQVQALHACGDLHRKLIKDWQQGHAESLILAPCCYEKWLKQNYQPLSKLAQKHNLDLTSSQVKLAVQESVTASEREQEMMHQLKTFRLTFDLIQRDVRGVDEYLPAPSLPQSAANWGVEKVIQQLAERKALQIPDSLNIKIYLEQAKKRYAEIRRLQLAGQAFRRALELWIVSDLALFLEQDNCNVELQEFCDRTLSPRNIQLIATR